MAEEWLVVLNRSDSLGFGFSLLGKAGLPHIIYKIEENSPAARSGELEAGDVLLNVNGTDVNRFTTKEVLKCLRLSTDPVTLKLKRDPGIAAHVGRYLSPSLQQGDDSPEQYILPSERKGNLQQSSHYLRNAKSNHYSSSSPSPEQLATLVRPSPSPPRTPPQHQHSPSPHPQSPHQSPHSPPHSNRSNGCSERSNNSKGSSNGCTDWSDRSSNGCTEKNSSNGWAGGGSGGGRGYRSQGEPHNPPPVKHSKFEAYMMTGELMLKLSRTERSGEGILGGGGWGGSPAGAGGPPAHPHRHHHAPRHRTPDYDINTYNSTPVSPIESRASSAPQVQRYNSTPASSGLDHQPSRCQEPPMPEPNAFMFNSTPTSPSDMRCARTLSSPMEGQMSPAPNNNHLVMGCVRTSRSEDHLQFQKESSMSAVAIDIDDDDVTSSLNTLLDTRPDSRGNSSGRQPATHPTDRREESQRLANRFTAELLNSGTSLKSDPFSCDKCQSCTDYAPVPKGSMTLVPRSIFHCNTGRPRQHTYPTPAKFSNGAHLQLQELIVWTYNAPVSSSSEKNTSQYNGSSSTTATSNSTSVSEGISPQRSLSPASPTSVSSSVMSSASISSRTPPDPSKHPPLAPNQQHSVSEAVSNISSPDYQEQGVDLFNGRECMEVSDPSDSDSTILVSEPCNKRVKCGQGGNPPYMTSSNPTLESNSRQNSDNSDSQDHRIVIQVKGPDKQDRMTNGDSPSAGRNNPNIKGNTQNGDAGQHTPESHGYHELREEEMCVGGSSSSSPEEACSEADADSLHSFHYSPKAVDIPSAIRLAKRLYGLDGFKKSDVSRHLSKNNDFSRAVAEEYLRYFNFDKDTLDGALRKFLRQFCLTGETQERERVLVHFSRRYLDCNPGTFNSQDAVHTLTCAIMLLNTDLHGQSAGRKMSCAEFIENLADLNDGANFPREILKALYHAIKSHPLEWALDSEAVEVGEVLEGQGPRGGGSEAHPTVRGPSVGSNPFLDVPDRTHAVEYKKGYVMRKCCLEENGKKTPFGKRGWKMFYCTLRDLILYLHKDEHGFRKNQMSDNLHNAIRIHHGLATKATDYTKKQHVFRLQTADQAEYLFQTSDSKELQSWIDTINFVCASFSAQPLAGGVGSQRKFQRPLLPCSHTKLTLREQLRDHEERCERIEVELKQPRQPGSSHHNREKEAYLQSELKRYRTYAYLIRSRVSQWGMEGAVAMAAGNNAGLMGEMEEGAEGALGAGPEPPAPLRAPPLPDRNPPPNTTSLAGGGG